MGLRPEHSKRARILPAATFEVRGEYDRAAAELREQVAARHNDPQTCLLLARLYRDLLLADDESAACFRQALARSPDAATEYAALREFAL